MHLGDQAALPIGAHGVSALGVLITMLHRAADGFGAAASPQF